MILFVRGFFMPLIALRFMWKHRFLMKYAVIPIIINIIIFTIGGIIGWIYFTDWLTSLLPGYEKGWYLQIVYYLLLFILGVFLAVFIVLTFTIVGNIIASPFQDILSEKTERIVLQNLKEESFSFKMLLGDVGRTLGQEVKKILFFGMVFLGLLVLNFLPGIGNLIYVFVNLIFTFLILALEFIDFPMSRRRMPFKQKIRFTALHILPMIGFGTSLFIISLIIFLNYILLPIAAVGGTLLYCELKYGRNLS